MDYQNKYAIYSYKQVSVDNEIDLKNYLKIVNNSLMRSDKVYIYRTHNHLSKKNDLIKWCANNQSKELTQIDVFFESFQRMLHIKSSDGSNILEVELAYKKNREEFSERFRIDYSSFRECFSDKILTKNMLIDDPQYDQYDFMFIKNDKIYIWTSIHELLLFLNEEQYEE